MAAIINESESPYHAYKGLGKWNSYDIIFRAPEFDTNGNRTKMANVTILHNGVLIHDNVDLLDKTGAGQQEGPGQGPLLLQDHGNKVKFRNVWIRPLATGS